MLPTPDLYLGTFLILCGFALSLLNLRRIVKKTSAQFSTVLLSENILLLCIGIAFVSRSVLETTSENVSMDNMEERSIEMINTMKHGPLNCDFNTVVMSYGPFVISLVNSFLSLIIDNYMHYRMIEHANQRDEENTVREISQEDTFARKLQMKKFYLFLQKYFSFIAVGIQWLIPFLMLLAMYPVDLQEKLIPLSSLRSSREHCMTMLSMNNETCSFEDTFSNFTLELRKHAIPTNYIEVYDNINKNDSIQIDTVVSNVYKIVANLQNNVQNNNITSSSNRQSKNSQKCVKMCFMDNKKLLLYMFLLVIVSYFVPVTISTVLLTKIHIMGVQRPNFKTYVSRELLYNLLFWTPVMFDTFLSLILCAYSMHGVRTSLFNVVANVYQAVKNFMNTKYFKDNSVVPI